MLEHDLNVMIDWFNANKLSLNLQKTVAMEQQHQSKPSGR